MKKIWIQFLETLRMKFYGGNIFVMKGRIPETKEEKYWYNRALEDSVNELRNYEDICESKYKSLIDCLSKNGISVCYNDRTNIHKIQIKYFDYTNDENN